MERKQESKGHTLPGDGRGRDKSGYGKKQSKRHTPTGDDSGRGTSGYRKMAT